MRVLHYIDAVRLDRGGVVRAVLDLTNELANAGAEVTLLTGDDTDVPPEWRDACETAPRLVTCDRSITPWFTPKTDRALLDELVAGVDVVHLHMPWDPFNPAVAAAARRAGKPYLLSVHGMLDDWCMAQRGWKKRVYLSLVGRRLLKQAAFVHYTAEGERDQAHKWVPASTPLVAPLLMDLSPYGELPTGQAAEEAFPALTATDEPRLLFLSRVDPKKGVDLLIEAVARLRDQETPVQAFIAGPGEPSYVETLANLARQHGVADRVHFLGMVRGELKWSLYRACELFVLPTHQENFGIVLVEAMGCALPTLTTHKVDIWQELKRNGAQIVDDAVLPVVEALQGMLADPDATKQHGEQGRRGVLDWLDPAKVSQQYLAAYEAAINGTTATRRTSP